MSEQLSLPEPKLTKRQRALLAELQRGRKISKAEIWIEFHLWNGGDQILKIRRAGYPVECEMVHRENYSFGRYYLPSAQAA